jgi:hypothetical protein
MEEVHSVGDPLATFATLNKLVEEQKAHIYHLSSVLDQLVELHEVTRSRLTELQYRFDCLEHEVKVMKGDLGQASDFHVDQFDSEFTRSA